MTFIAVALIADFALAVAIGKYLKHSTTEKERDQ